MKETLILFNLQKHGTGNGFSNIKDTFAQSFAATNVSSAPKYLDLQGWPLKFIWLLGKIERKSTWCVRSQSKCWNNMQFQTQVYITERFIHQKGAKKLVKYELDVTM